MRPELSFLCVCCGPCSHQHTGTTTSTSGSDIAFDALVSSSVVLASLLLWSRIALHASLICALLLVSRLAPTDSFHGPITVHRGGNEALFPRRGNGLHEDNATHCHAPPKSNHARIQVTQ